MKKLISGIVLLSSQFLIPNNSFSQQQAAYKVPDSYNFDYLVVQQVKSDKKKSTPDVLNYYYTANGEYMGLQSGNDKTKWMIFTKDGASVIVDDDKKTITIFRFQNLIGDLAKMGPDQKKNNATPTSPRSDSSRAQAVKTGNTKQICGYPSEEYRYTNSKGESMSIWYAKVDFNASLFLLMGMGAGSAGKSPMGMGGMGKYPQTQGYPSMTDPHLLIAETKSDNHPDEGITTQSISKKTNTISTKAYTINNYSNMGLQEMIEMQMKQKNPN